MDLSAITDAELVSFITAGKAEALDELYSRYSQPVFSMAYSMLRDYEAAEDITQEVFLALWIRSKRFDPDRGVFRHWFLHMAHNRVIDEIRRRKRVAQHNSDKAPEDPGLALESPVDTAEQAVISALSGVAYHAITKLPEEQRVAVVMAYLEGATQQEIAQRTGVPLGTVKTRLRLGLSKLRDTMAKRSGEEV